MKYMCPSCGEVLDGEDELRKHWKNERYGKGEEYKNFENYRSDARYEYLSHIGWKRIQFKIGDKTYYTFPEDFIEELKRKAREAFGPNPPCVICGEESEFCIVPRPLQPETWLEDLQRQHLFSMLPVLPCFCNKHSDEEISEWFKKKGIDLKIEIKRKKK